MLVYILNQSHLPKMEAQPQPIQTQPQQFPQPQASPPINATQPPYTAPLATTQPPYAAPVATTQLNTVPTSGVVAAAQPQPIASFVTYDEYTGGRLSCTPAETKTVPGTGPTPENPTAVGQSYYQIPLMYNFGTQEQRVLNDFLLEGCEMETAFGIQSKQAQQQQQKPGQAVRMEHSIMSKFDMNNPHHVRFLETINQIHQGCGYILSQMKGSVKLYNFNPQMAEATGFKNPVYRPRDEMTGEPVVGRAPSMFFKLFSRGKPPLGEQTLFTTPDGTPIPWALMNTVEMKFIPLLSVKRIYIGGGKASLQLEMVSAIVTSLRPRNTNTRQTDTINRLNTARPELSDTVSAQVAKLTLDRQEQLLGNNAPQNNTPVNNGGEQPTFSGLITNKPNNNNHQQGNTNYQQQPQGNNNYQQPQQGALPPIPALGMSMQDFTASAPTRTPAGMIQPGFTGQNGVVPQVGFNNMAPQQGFNGMVPQQGFNGQGGMQQQGFNPVPQQTIQLS